MEMLSIGFLFGVVFSFVVFGCGVIVGYFIEVEPQESEDKE